MITLNNGSTTQPGTVICGTMRNDDIIPALISEARQCRLWVLQLESDYRVFSSFIASGSGLVGDIDQAHETISWIADELFYMLDSIAPDGYYFGAHWGDGADFGWWQSEDSDY